MVPERHSFRSVQPSWHSWEEISAAGGVCQHDQPRRQRGSFPFSPCPSFFLPSCVTGEKILGSVRREPSRAIFPPQRKDSVGPSQPSCSPQSLLSPSSSPMRRGGGGAGKKGSELLLLLAHWEFRATSPRARVKGCQVPGLSEQVLVDCAVRKKRQSTVRMSQQGWGGEGKRAA